ncbi:MAG: hypothetical protein AABX71_01455, partial [Nanoarchaeota archaeon]
MPEDYENQELAEEENSEEISEEDNSQAEGEKEKSQEYLEILANKYSLDETGRAKLAEDIKGLEKSYHSSRQELAQMREILEDMNEGEEEEEKTTSTLPIDTT